MSLRDDLHKQWQLVRESFPDARDASEALVRRLMAADVGRSGLKPGDQLPAFEMPNVEGQFVSSNRLLERGPLVIAFFRGTWCPYCTLELKALQQALPEINDLGATLVAITPDTGAALAADKYDNNVEYEILSDIDQGLGLLFGVIFAVPDEIRQFYLGNGVDLGARHGNDTGRWLLPFPATYVVDRTGTIRHAETDPDFRRRMEPADIIHVLRGLATERR
jgi:peroxiredoxin